MFTYGAVALISTLLLLIQIGEVSKSSSKRPVLSLALLCIELVLLLFTVNNPDYKTYQSAYETGGGPFKEEAMALISSFMDSIGLPEYGWFLFIVFILILFCFIKYHSLSKYVFVAIYLYSLFIMFYDVIQVRNTVAAFLVFTGIYYLGSGKYIRCALCLCIAPLFHRIALILIALAIISAIIARTSYKIGSKSIFAPVMIALVIAIGGSGLVFSLSSVEYFNHLALYIDSDWSFDSMIIWGGFELFIIYAMNWAGILDSCNEKDGGRVQRVSRILLLTALLGLAFSGFLVFVNEFNRIYRFFFLALYLVIGLQWDKIPHDRRNPLLVVLALGSVAFMCIAIMRGINFDIYW